jgi:hypothetical protein
MNNINFTDIYLQTQTAGLAERNEQRRRQLEANGANVPAPRRTVRMPQWFADSLKVIRYHLPRHVLSGVRNIGTSTDWSRLRLVEVVAQYL